MLRDSRGRQEVTLAFAGSLSGTGSFLARDGPCLFFVLDCDVCVGAIPGDSPEGLRRGCARCMRSGIESEPFFAHTSRHSALGMFAARVVDFLCGHAAS